MACLCQDQGYAWGDRVMDTELPASQRLWSCSRNVHVELADLCRSQAGHGPPTTPRDFGLLDSARARPRATRRCTSSAVGNPPIPVEHIGYSHRRVKFVAPKGRSRTSDKRITAVNRIAYSHRRVKIVTPMGSGTSGEGLQQLEIYTKRYLRRLPFVPS